MGQHKQRQGKELTSLACLFLWLFHKGAEMLHNRSSAVCLCGYG